MEKIDRISGLDKLLELLTEHCRRYYGFKEKDDIKIGNDSCNFYLYLKGIKLFTIQPERLIFKHFLFIKWLVENNKIDFNNVRETNYGWEFNYYWTIPNSKRDKEIQVERLLMILSIQDDPISFLVSILK